MHVRARLLGAFEVEIEGRPLDRGAFERPSGLRVLKLLLATPEHRVRREEAAELLWPEADPERSSGNLRKAIHFARRALATVAGEEEVVTSDGEGLRLSPHLRLDVDVDRLLGALRQVESRDERARVSPADPLEIVATLGGAELLPEDPYEEWLVPIRERLRERVMAATLEGAIEARSTGDAELAARLADRALGIDPAEESAHRALIELHIEAGRLHAARRQLLACRRALADAYGVEPSPELVKLVDAAAAARARARQEVVAEPELIGRRLELERAEPVLDAVAAGQLGVLLLRGPAGIGKSRLLREIVRLGAAGGWRILELRGLEHAADTPFATLGQALANTLDGATVDAWSEPARSAVLTVAPAVADRRADAASAGRGDRTKVVGFANDAGLRAGLIAAFSILSSDRPLVLAIDDVQWLEAATLSLLHEAVAEEGRPMLVAATLRDEPREPAPELEALVEEITRRGGTALPLPPLGRREIELLLERQLEGAGLGTDVGARVAELSGGTPLYALQLLRGAQESGAITLRDGGWTLAAAAGALPVPQGVRRAVEDRAGRLAVEVRSILEVAAELGDEVAYELVVAAAAGEPDSVLEALDRALELGLIVDRAGRYRFGHPLYRAVLRDGVPRGARAQLHARIAQALAGGVDPADGAAVDAAIASGADAVAVATHAAEAVRLGKMEVLPLAIGFGFAAGARQLALFDHGGAAVTLRQALGLWSRLPSKARTAFPVSPSHHRLGLALKARGDHAGAAEAFRAEIATATNDLDRARGYNALSWLPYEHGRFDRSAEVLREGIAALHDPIARAYLESGLGWMRGRQGSWREAYELLEPTVAVLEGAPADILARGLDRFAVAMRDLGTPEVAIHVFRRALALCRETGNFHEEAIVRMHLATALRDAGDAAGGREQVERAIALTRMTGDRYIEAVSHWILAEVEDTAGRLVEAAAARRAELEILDAIGGNPQNQAMAHAHLAHLAARAGEPGVAAAEAEAARSLAAHAGLDYLPALVDRAISAGDWFKVSHRHTEEPVADAVAGSPGS